MDEEGKSNMKSDTLADEDVEGEDDNDADKSGNSANTDQTDSTSKPTRKKKSDFYYYVSTSDEEADTVRDTFWRDLSEGKLDLTTADDETASGRGGRRARSAFLEASNKLSGSSVGKSLNVATEPAKRKTRQTRSQKGKASVRSARGERDSDEESGSSVSGELSDHEYSKKKVTKKSPPSLGGKKGKNIRGKGKKNQKPVEEVVLADEQDSVMDGKSEVADIDNVSDKGDNDKSTAEDIYRHMDESINNVVSASDEYIETLLQSSTVIQQHLQDTLTEGTTEDKSVEDSANEAEDESNEDEEEIGKVTKKMNKRARQLQDDTSETDDDTSNKKVADSEQPDDDKADEQGDDDDEVVIESSVKRRLSSRISVESLSDSESKLVIADFCPDEEERCKSPEAANVQTSEEPQSIEVSKTESDPASEDKKLDEVKNTNDLKPSTILPEKNKSKKIIQGPESAVYGSSELRFELEQIEELSWNNKPDEENVKVKTANNIDLRKAVFENNQVFVKQVLQSKSSHIDVEQKNGASGKTLSMIAAEKGYDSVLRSLILKGADVNATADDGSTALILAADMGHQFAVNTLLYAGANVNARESKTGETALVKAIKKGHYGVVLSLVQHGVNIGMSGVGDKTALALARLYKHQDIVDLLTSHRARLRSALLSQIEIELNRSGRVGLPVFGIQCLRLLDGPQFSIVFRHELQPSSAKSGMLLFIGHGNVSLHQADCRLDGDCYVSGVTLNGNKLKALSEKNCFIMALGPMNNGHNCVNITTVPLTKENYETQLIIWALHIHLT